MAQMKTDLPDWYDPSKSPEWRVSSPWVMDDMMSAQPTNVVDTMKAVTAEAAQVASVAKQAVADQLPVVVVGVGTAGHAARGVAVALNAALGDATGRRVEFRESEDEGRAPRNGGVCIAVSHGGASNSTIGALEAARSVGARTTLITAASSSPAHEFADIVLQLPARDQSSCHTVGYTSPIAAGLEIGAHISGEVLPAGEITAYLSNAVTALRAAAEPIGIAWSNVTRIISAGSQVDEPSARELALDVAEAAWIPSSAFGLEDVLHGQMVGHDSDSGLVVTLTGGPGLERGAATAQSLLRAAARIGIRVTLIASAEASHLIDAECTPDGRIALPETALPPVISTLFGGAVALQSLAIALVAVKGTNPDLLRREQDPYREAMALAGSKRKPVGPRL